MKNMHVLLIPYPAQGHVTSLMEAAQCLTSNGLKVTFVNTVGDLGKMTKAIFQHMPSNDINKNNEEKITCVIADYSMGWVLRVAQKMGIRLAIFSPTLAKNFGLDNEYPKPHR
ncbi:hypothetical protein R6Q59_020134 [Mikania micrantha]